MGVILEGRDAKSVPCTQAYCIHSIQVNSDTTIDIGSVSKRRVTSASNCSFGLHSSNDLDNARDIGRAFRIDDALRSETSLLIMILFDGCFIVGLVWVGDLIWRLRTYCIARVGIVGRCCHAVRDLEYGAAE